MKWKRSFSSNFFFVILLLQVVCSMYECAKEDDGSKNPTD